MDNIHPFLAETAKRARNFPIGNLCICFKQPDDLQQKDGEHHLAHEQRVYRWLLDQGAYKQIKGRKWNYDYPSGSLTFQAYEFTRESLLLCATHDKAGTNASGCVCIFDTVAYFKQQGVELEPWFFALAQFAAIARPELGQAVGVYPPPEDFVLELWQRDYSSLGPDCEYDEMYGNVEDHFQTAITKRNEYLPKEDSIESVVASPEVRTIAQLKHALAQAERENAILREAARVEADNHLASEEELAEEVQRVEQLISEVEQLRQQLEAVTAERDSLLRQFKQPQPTDWVSVYRAQSKGFDALLRVVESELLEIAVGREPKKSYLQTQLSDVCKAAGIDCDGRKSQGIISLIYPDSYI